MWYVSGKICRMSTRSGESKESKPWFELQARVFQKNRISKVIRLVLLVTAKDLERGSNQRAALEYELEY